ncbi:MFS transporter, DHA1 family, bicyclomycin/chloramphenicol resistance protein [Ruaniaceae bacterium KH17]|nr:MFS transporter, DHA1 family, bicyclomycin/chloramphenicol resistance protein [Ruaniaceae bacterium KH17]
MTENRPSLKFSMLVGAMAAIPAVTMDMYLPSMPQIAIDLNTTQALVQGTISATLIGAGIGQLVNGPVSDRFGRRLPFFFGVGLHVLMSIACMFAPNIQALIAFRLLQGIGNASAAVAAMAVIRDRFTGPAVAAGISRNMMVVSAAPIIAPAIGGFLANYFGWQGVFAALALFGVVMLFGVWRFLPETHPHERRTKRGEPFLRAYLPLLTDWSFLRVALIPAFSMVVLMSFVSSASFTYQEHFGLSAGMFAAAFALNGIGIISASQFNSRLVYRAGSPQILLVALSTEAVIAATLLVLALLGLVNVWVFAIATFLLVSVNAVTMPNGASLALAEQGHRAGTAAALLGAFQSGIGGLLSPLVGVFGGDVRAFAIVALGALVIALTFFLSGPRPQLRPRVA